MTASVDVAGQLKQIGKDTLFYGLGTVLQGFISFLLFPIYTRVLTQSDFGAQDLVLTAVTILSYFLILGLDSGTARHYYDGETPEEKSAVLSTWLLFELAASIPFTILLLLFARPISALFFNDPSLAPYFRLGVVALPVSMTVRVMTLTLRLTFQAKKFSLIVAFGALTQALTAILLVVVLHMGVSGVFLAILASAVMQLLVGLRFTYANYHLAFSGKLLKSMLAFGVPLVPASLSIWILNNSNRYFLAHLANLNEIGLLGVGVRVSNILTMLISAFLTAWPPFAYSLFKDMEVARHTYAKILTYFLLATSFIAAGLTVFGREVVIVLATKTYETSVFVLPWLLFSSIAWGMVSIVGIGCDSARKSYHYSIATILGALVTTGLNILLIPLFNIRGAAAATMCGNITALTYIFFTGRHYLPIRFEFRKLATLVALFAFVAVATQRVDLLFTQWQPTLLIYKGLLFVAFLLGLFLFKVVTPAEVGAAVIYLKSRLTFRKAAQ